MLVALGITFGALLLVLANLDNPTVAGWLKRTLARDAGLELDYDELSVYPFSGLHATKLRIRTPAPYAAHAPELFALDRADIGWSFWPLLGGEIRVSRLELAGMHLAMVTDETGKTSIDALLEAMGIPEDTTPLSQSLQELPVMSVASLDIGDIAVTLVDIEAGAPVARTTLSGICVSGPVATSGAGLDAAELRLAPCGAGQASDPATPEAPAGVRVRLESPSGPDQDGAARELDDSHALVRELVIDLQGTLTAPEPQRVAIALTGELVSQTLLPGAALPRALVHIQSIDLAFDPAAQKTHVQVPGASLLDGAITAEASVDLHDRPDGTVTPLVHHLRGAVDLQRLVALGAGIAGLAQQVDMAGARLTYDIGDVSIAPETGMVERGRVRIAADVPAMTMGTRPDARVRADAGDVPGAGSAAADMAMQLERASLLVDARLGTPGDSTLRVEARVARLDSEMTDDGQGTPRPASPQTGQPTSQHTAMTGFELIIDGKELQLDLDTPLLSRGTLAMDVRLESLLLGSTGASSTGAGSQTASQTTSQTTGVRDLHLHGELLADGSTITTSGALPIAQVTMRDPAAGLDLQLDGIELGWRADRAHWSFARPIQASMDVRLTRVAMKQPGQSIDLDDLRAQLQATARSPRRFDLALTVPWNGIRLRGAGGLAVSLGAGELGITGSDLAMDPKAPEHTRGRIRVASSLPRVDARTPEMTAAVRDLALSVDAVLAGARPPTIEGELPIGRLDIRDRATGKPVAQVANGRLAWQVSDLVLHPTDPLRTTAEIAIQGALPRVVLPAGDAAATDGTDAGAAKDATTTLSLPRIDATVSMQGARQIHDARLRLVLGGVDTAGARRGDNLVATLQARAELRKPGIRMDFGVRGPDGPELAARLAAHYQRDRRSLVYDLALTADRLEALEAYLPAAVRAQHQLDWEALSLKVEGKGELRELIRRLGKDMTPILADDPVLALRGNQALTLSLTGLDYRAPNQIDQTGQPGQTDQPDQAAQAVHIPQLDLRFQGSREDGPIQARLDITAPRIHLESAGAPVDITGLAHHLALSSDGPPEHGRVDLQLDTTVARVDQELVGYPVANLTLAVRGHLDRLASLRIDELRFDNPAGGTSLEATAAMDRVLPPGATPPAASAAAASAAAATPADAGDTALAIPGRQALSLTGRLRQDLGTIALGKGAPRMRGQVALPFRIESGDLSAFQIATQAQLDDVHVTLPREGIAIEGFDGVIPVALDLAVTPGGDILVLGNPAKNLYSRTRFLDVHPFLRDQHFLSVDRITAMGETIGPLAGNLRVERDTLALDQLQIGYRGGNISGQLLVDYRNGSPSMQFRGNITGVRPGGEEDGVIDANTAITLVPDKLAVEGRVQILRIGRQHLLDVLDVIDPYREDVDINRVRLGLRVGYPKFVRLVMKDGFLAVKVELGGVAKLVRIGEIRGIALGPLMNIYVAPLLTEGAGETP